MPLYELECTSCNRIFEQQIPLDEFDEDVECPVCGEIAEKLISKQKVIHSSVASWRLPLNQSD